MSSLPTVTQVTTAHIEPDYSPSYEFRASWKTATTFSATEDKSKPRLVIEVPAHKLNGRPFLQVEVKTFADGTTTMRPVGAIEEADKLLFCQHGGLYDAYSNIGGVGGKYNYLLAGLFNSALESAAKNERVDPALIDDDGGAEGAPALEALWNIFRATSATNIEDILSDTDSGYMALTKYSFAVMLAIALHDGRFTNDYDQGRASNVKLSTGIYSEVLLGQTEVTNIVDIVIQRGAVFQFPFSYVHQTVNGQSPSIVHSLVIKVTP
jgi:hypothetical protein